MQAVFRRFWPNPTCLDFSVVTTSELWEPLVVVAVKIGIEMSQSPSYLVFRGLYLLAFSQKEPAEQIKGSIEHLCTFYTWQGRRSLSRPCLTPSAPAAAAMAAEGLSAWTEPQKQFQEGHQASFPCWWGPGVLQLLVKSNFGLFTGCLGGLRVSQNTLDRLPRPELLKKPPAVTDFSLRSPAIYNLPRLLCRWNDSLLHFLSSCSASIQRHLL